MKMTPLQAVIFARQNLEVAIEAAECNRLHISKEKVESAHIFLALALDKPRIYC